jgi:hypothetical protein
MGEGLFWFLCGSASHQARLGLDDFLSGGLGGGEFSVTMGFGARISRVQLANFSDRCAAGAARHRQDLLWRKIIAFHEMDNTVSGYLQAVQKCSVGKNLGVLLVLIFGERASRMSKTEDS